MYRFGIFKPGASLGRGYLGIGGREVNEVHLVRKRKTLGSLHKGLHRFQVIRIPVGTDESCSSKKPFQVLLHVLVIFLVEEAFQGVVADEEADLCLLRVQRDKGLDFVHEAGVAASRDRDVWFVCSIKLKHGKALAQGCTEDLFVHIGTG